MRCRPDSRGLILNGAWYTTSPRVPSFVRSTTFHTRRSASWSDVSAHVMYRPEKPVRFSGSTKGSVRVPQKPPPSVRTMPRQVTASAFRAPGSTSLLSEMPPITASSMRSKLASAAARPPLLKSYSVFVFSQSGSWAERAAARSFKAMRRARPRPGRPALRLETHPQSESASSARRKIIALAAGEASLQGSCGRSGGPPRHVTGPPAADPSPLLTPPLGGAVDDVNIGKSGTGYLIPTHDMSRQTNSNVCSR